MNSLQKYIAKRKKTEKDFAKNYEESFENLKTSKSFAERAENGDWEKARGVLAKVSDIKAKDCDKL